MGVTAGQSFATDGRRLWPAAPGARWDQISRAGPTLQVESCTGSSVEDRPASARRKLQTHAGDPRSPGSSLKTVEESGLIPVGTKARSPWDELSPKPVRPRSPTSRRAALQSFIPGGTGALSRSSSAAAHPRSGSSRQRPGWQSAGRWSLTLATDWRQAGGDGQQQHPCRRRGPALHRGDGPGPRRSFPGRWARVAAGTGRLLRSGTGVLLSTSHWLLEAESRPGRLRHPVFYPRQSPPSRRCIKPSRPDRPGTSMRESSGPGPLLPGPPPALCDSGRSGHSNTCAVAHAHSTRAHACACSQPRSTGSGNTKPPHTLASANPSLAQAHTHGPIQSLTIIAAAHTRARAYPRHSLRGMARRATKNSATDTKSRTLSPRERNEERGESRAATKKEK